MTDLEVFRLSAEACGETFYEATDGFGGKYLHTNRGEWHPFTNAGQRWQCVEKLLEARAFIVLDPAPGNHHSADAVAWRKEQRIKITCPASEFPARALAELWRRSQ